MADPMVVSQPIFTDAVLDPDLPTPPGLIDPTGRPAGKRFDVYRNNVVTSLIDAMQTAFPVIHKLVGTEFFNAMAGVYVREFPPENPMLMFYGTEFPAFLSTFEPVAHLAYLPDVARLELARRQSYHAADALGFDPQTLVDMPEDALLQSRFDLVPAAQIIRSEHPIQSIWHHNMIDNAHPVAPHGETVLIFRPEFDVDAALISPSIAHFLEHIQCGETLETAFEQTQQIDNEFDISNVITMMISTGIINKIKG
ncbi:DUF2063 domain-containing protein [Amylibacter ulvae]|uniref:DUF2063 domain-containing protein n=1 Tax=Paramylibacter ulvae TaxID=1651968 RepID=A0ABQ3CX11_9RHOB|nr:DNA-binding domain-containing protein [Amylibacter ulvae]GHA40236.1 DUF2063 domain-containing protein [Amylibacter ulvae]